VGSRVVAAIVVVAAFGGGSPARGQAAARPELPDPRRAIVFVDDAGDVGLRIADAQAAHEVVIARLRKRLGNDAVVYEGARKSAAQMKRLLGAGAETTMQDAQLAYYDAAAKAAPWRVRVRFGQKKNEHWITVACRRADDGAKKSVDEQRFTGRSFLAARDAADAGLDKFCLALPATAAMVPVEQPRQGDPSTTTPAIPGLRKREKTSRPWTPPPRRD
jgi:hypothetical protein